MLDEFNNYKGDLGKIVLESITGSINLVGSVVDIMSQRAVPQAFVSIQALRPYNITF